jgi:hypothetical protein
MEDRLSSSWDSLLRGDFGGARRSHWLRELVAAANDYDYVLIDAGPSLGALNRTVLLGSDVFIAPTAADLFSLFALDNIRTWIKAWSRSYAHGIEQVAEEFPEVSELDWPSLHGKSASSAFLGFTIQQYVTKALNDGNRRKTNAYDHYAQQIPTRAAELAKETGARPGSPLNLGLVPYMFSMVPLAQSAHAPISALTPHDGLRGAQISQQSKYAAQLSDIGSTILARLDEELSTRA